MKSIGAFFYMFLIFFLYFIAFQIENFFKIFSPMAGEKSNDWETTDANDNAGRNTEKPTFDDSKPAVSDRESGNGKRFGEGSHDESRERSSYERRPRYPREDRFSEDRRSSYPREDKFSKDRRPAYPREDRFSEDRRPSYPREDRFSEDRRPAYPREDRFSEDRRSSYSREGGRYGDDRRPAYPRDDRSYRRRDSYDDQAPSRFRSYNGDRFEKRPRQMREDPTEPNVTIGIFNLSYNLTQRDFEEFLNSKLTDFEGKFTSKLVISNETGRCRGYGFVTFESLEDSIKAKPILENGELLGQQYRVAFSIQRRNFDRKPVEQPANSEKEGVESENN